MKMVEIIKRDGRREEFAPEKLRTSIQKAGAREETAREVARRVEEKTAEGTRTERIKEMVFEELEREEPQVVEKMRRYDREVKKR